MSMYLCTPIIIKKVTYNRWAVIGICSAPISADLINTRSRGSETCDDLYKARKGRKKHAQVKKV